MRERLRDALEHEIDGRAMCTTQVATERAAENPDKTIDTRGELIEGGSITVTGALDRRSQEFGHVSILWVAENGLQHKLTTPLPLDSPATLFYRDDIAHTTRR